MYFNQGINPNEIGDFDVIADDDGNIHAFYLALPSHDRIGHLVSRDGINWIELPTALYTGKPGEFDSDQIWTMGVFRNNGKWFMLYTGNEKNGLVQRIGLATSDDLMTWRKYGKNPVSSPDPRWYEAEQKGSFRIAWRDPHVVFKDNIFHAFICAREKTGLLNRRGCAAYVTSRDGYNWETKQPACTPRTGFDLECPSVCEIRKKFYMFGISGGHGRMIYRVSDKISGPYNRPADDTVLPERNLSVRPLFWKKKMHLFHWIRGNRDWGGSREGFAALASPKTVEADNTGALKVKSFDWSELYKGNAVMLDSDKKVSMSCGFWKFTGNKLNASSENGAAICLSKNSFADFEISADCTLPGKNPAAEFGFAIRTDEEGDEGLFLHCIPSRYTVELVKLIHNRPFGPESLKRGRTVLTSFHLPPCDGKYMMRLIAFGPSLEFNVNGRLVIHHFTLPRRKGRCGVFVEDGSAVFKNLSIRPIQAPKCNWGDLSIK